MPELTDCYALAPKRSACLVQSFLDHFLPQREPSYAHEDPSEVLGISSDAGLDQILGHLEVQSTVHYSMYFRNTNTCNPLHAAAIFNDDGSLLLMLSIAGSTEVKVAKQFLNRLKSFTGASFAYSALEEPPVSNMHEFMKRASKANQ